MRKSQGGWVIGILICSALAGLFALPLRGEETAEAVKTEPVAAISQEKELDIRYAEAYLKLMEATLRRYEEINRGTPNVIRPAVIQRIQDSVRKADERVKMAKSDHAGESQIYVSSAEADLRLAEEALRLAQATNARAARSIGDGEIARLKAQVELAKVRVDRVRHLASESELSNVRYELEILREDVQELQVLVSLLRSRN